MTNSIKLSESDWASLHDRIKQDYPRSVTLIREKMKRALGFVPREHEEWILGNVGNNLKFPTTTIYLDFYDDKKKTMFVMKYSEYLEGKL